MNKGGILDSEQIKIMKTSSLDENKFISSAEIYYNEWGDILRKELIGRDKPLIQIVLDQFKKRSEVFPEGQLSAYHDSLNMVLGNINSLRINYDYSFKDWKSLTGDGYFTTHNPKGNSIICPAVNTSKEARNLGIKGVAKKLILSARDVAISLKSDGLKNMFVFTRPSGYSNYAKKHGKVSIEEYLSTKTNGKLSEFKDPIDLHIGLGAKILTAFENARPADSASKGYCVLMMYEI